MLANLSSSSLIKFFLFFGLHRTDVGSRPCPDGEVQRVAVSILLTFSPQKSMPTADFAWFDLGEGADFLKYVFLVFNQEGLIFA